ncbi:hypothetical protein QWY84_15995 [Aquisalimonas lutea]|uniref:hypothetical protein n=1 Tax=Aquisalimonas lutea TaxID=1327750 RepID=UPI0025B522F6|nr:hypothetical protein [Aquisalimonas lutea]MDN3519117.1 hypothetical protein [Aquisalimonas lutea]
MDEFHNVAHRFKAYQIPVKHRSSQAGSIGIEGEIRDYNLRVQKQMEKLQERKKSNPNNEKVFELLAAVDESFRWRRDFGDCNRPT